MNDKFLTFILFGMIVIVSLSLAIGLSVYIFGSIVDSIECQKRTGFYSCSTPSATPLRGELK